MEKKQPEPTPAKVIVPTEEVQLPELEIHSHWRSILTWASQIKHIVWILSISAILIAVVILMPYFVRTNLWVSIWAQWGIFVLVLGFALVAVSLIWTLGQQIDVWIFMLFNMRGKRPAWLDWTMLGVTQLGNFIFVALVAVIVFFRVSQFFAYELVVGTLSLGLVVQIMKFLIHRTRPFLTLKNIRIVGSRASGQSFPSGHTSQAFFLATVLSQFFQVNISLWVIIYVVALLVGITRIYVGMHYPRDVIAGAVLGTAWGLLGIFVNGYIYGYFL
ncbi:MAG: phosphatase PAP2 family protein [Clostridia bacterium]